jgi:hypothetical protein
MRALAATVEPTGAPAGEVAVVLRVENTSGAAVAVPDPDLGRPSDDSDWPHSLEAYRASLMLSFGMLAVSVRDADGEEVAKAAVSTWSTPYRRPDLRLAPGGKLDVVIPLGPLFELRPGEHYRVAAKFGPARGEGDVVA